MIHYTPGVLACDFPGCRRVLATRRRAGGWSAELRRLALERGWSRDGRGGDRCPDHADPGGAVARPPAAG